MSIVLDSRERGLIDLMKETPWQQLPVGDAWIQYEGATKLVIERKTTADFEASFLDGRYREQRTRLLAFCAEHKAKPLYILEGGLDGKRHRLERSALQKLVHRLCLRYGVAVWCTKDMADTAATLTMLGSQVRDEPTVFEGETLSYTDVQHITKKANKDDPRAFAVAALQGCPGISVTAAKTLLDAFGSLKGCLEQTPEALAEVKVGQRKLGRVVGTRLAALLQGSSAAPS